MHLRALPLVFIAAPVVAQDFDFVIDQAVSQSTLISSAQVTLPGSAIGVYDATTNPGGTRTVNGQTGGSGNEVVPMNMVIDNSSLLNGTISGAFGLSIDLTTGTMSVDNMELDLLTVAQGTTRIDLVLLYNTFTTYNPDSLFVGGSPVTVSLGTFPIISATVKQNAPSQGGQLGPPKGSDFSFWVGIPVEVLLVVDFNGTLAPIGPFSVTMSLPGTLTYTATGMFFTGALVGTSWGSVDDPFPGFGINDAPLNLPTIQPPGSTANLLFNSVIANITHDVTVDFVVEADGVPSCGFMPYCDANLNSTGFPATISATGSADVTDKDLTLNVGSLPANQFGYFLMSQTQGYLPLFGGSEGILCLGSPMLRFSKYVLNSGAPGTMAFSIDFDNLPQGTVFAPGSTWNFQLWHRDKGGKSNTTSGISVLFCT